MRKQRHNDLEQEYEDSGLLMQAKWTNVSIPFTQYQLSSWLWCTDTASILFRENSEGSQFFSYKCCCIRAIFFIKYLYFYTLSGVKHSHYINIVEHIRYNRIYIFISNFLCICVFYWNIIQSSLPIIY